MTKYKCKRCGRALEVFREAGKIAAACSNGTCIGAYEYELYDSEEKLIEALENNASDDV